MVFIVTDIHYPASVQVSDDFDGDNDNLNFYELVTGPLSAQPELQRKTDPTINASYLYKENSVFTFGSIEFIRGPDGLAHMFYKVYDENGIVRPFSLLHLTPE